MREENKVPIWIKALLGFALVLLGLFFTFIVFRLFPIPQGTGFDGLNSLLYVFFVLGAIEIIYILGIVMMGKRPYSVFSICLALFLIALILIRWLVV